MPDHYDFYLVHLIQEGLLASEEVIYGEGVTGEMYQTFEEPDLSIFSPREKEVLEKVVHLFRPMGARQIADCSHAEEGYKRTSPGQVISYEWAQRLRVDV